MKHRRYDQRSLRDFLRYIRNKKHHRDEDAKVSDLLTHDASVFLDHFTSRGRFPNLVSACFQWVCETSVKDEPHFAALLGMQGALAKAPGKRECKDARRGWWVRDWPNSDLPLAARAPAPAANWKSTLCEHWERTQGASCVKNEDCGFAHGLVELRAPSESAASMPLIVPKSLPPKKAPAVHREWYAPDWQSSELEFAMPSALAGNAKTILCEHWARSDGTRCVMGDKCGFAHGLVELRESDGITWRKRPNGGGGAGSKAFSASSASKSGVRPPPGFG
jgi:hypothetical protein